MDQVHVIRHKVLVEGRTQRSVAREMGMSRVTVRKYLDQAAPSAPGGGTARPAGLGRRWGHGLRRCWPSSKDWTGGKQRLTATRLHELLIEEGHRVGVTLVKDAVAEWKRQRREVMIPLTYRPGELAEVDFFEVLVDVAGVRRKAWLFLLRLMYSGRDFGWIYARQDQISFLDGHVRAFAHLGVPARLAYDNLRAAVRRILVGGERALTDRFAALASHYLMEPCFCRPGEGHDKGGVEARGKAIDSQALVPIPSGPTLDAINATLLTQLDARREQRRAGHAQTIGELFLRGADAPASRRGAVSVADATTVATISPAGARADRGRHVLGAVPLGGPGSDDLDRRHHGDARRATGERIDHPRKRFGERSIDYRHYLPMLAREAAGGAPSPAGPAARSGDAVSRRSGISSHAAHGPRDAARIFAKILGPARDARRRRSSCRSSSRRSPAARRRWLALGAGAPTSCALPADAIPALAARGRDRRRLRRRLRRVAAGGGRMSATLTRDLIVTQARALKLPGLARTFERARAPGPRCALAARRLPARGAQCRARLAPRIGDPPAAARGAVSRGEDAGHV